MFRKDEQIRIVNAVATAITENMTAAVGRPVEVSIDGLAIGHARLKIAMSSRLVSLDVELKTALTPATVAGLAAAGTRDDLIILTSRLTRSVMSACRRLGVNCADADGNVFLRLNAVVIDVEGRPATISKKLTSATDRATLLTSRSGLQVVFVLLAVPEIAPASLRELAAAAGTSLGSVASVVTELTQHGYATKTSGGRSLRRTRELFNMWVDGYRLRLAPRLRLGTFSTEVKDWWAVANDTVRATGGQWGSETALWARGLNLRPARGIVYADDVTNDLVKKLRLRRDQGRDAPIEFRRRFWNLPEFSGHSTVETPLIYADLLADGDPRLVEAAADLRRNDDDLRRIDES